MFGTPSAKRVKRSHLFRDDDSSKASRESSGSPSPLESRSDLEFEDAKVSYGYEYDFIVPNPLSTENAPIEDPEEPEEPEYQFRLFGPASTSEVKKAQREASATDVKIRLSATPEPQALEEALSLENAHFIRPHRPDSYYFSSALPVDELQQLQSEYNEIALSSADVVSRAASTKWPGTALPWRLIHVKVVNKPHKSQVRTLSSQDKPITEPTDTAHPSFRARTRPSKKRRILLRHKLALRSELAAQTKISEETEREKRTRRNREKKVKKKEREKRKKLEVDGAGKVDRGGGVSHPSRGEGESGADGVEAPAAAPQPPGQSISTTIPEFIEATTMNLSNAKHVPLTSAVTSSTAEHNSGATTSTPTTRKAPVGPPTRRAPTSRAPTAPATGKDVSTRIGSAGAPTSALARAQH